MATDKISIVQQITKQRSIDVATIENELTKLWKTAESSKNSSEVVVRVCILNFVIYTTNEEIIDSLSEIIAAITERAPCRAIILIGNINTTENSTKAWISSHCHLTQNRQQVCCEEIRIYASGTALEHIAETAAPLLIIDLPIFLWWYDAKTFSSNAIRKFANQINRVIIDSFPLTYKDQDFLQQILWLTEHYPEIILSDLHWARLKAWRQSISSLFDQSEICRYLQELSTVTIDYAVQESNSEEPPLSTILIIAWLATTLGWIPKQLNITTDNNLQFIFTNSNKFIHCIIQKQLINDFSLCSIIGITLGTENAAATFSVKADSQNKEEVFFKTTAQLPDTPLANYKVNFQYLQDENLIANEVEIFGPDPKYFAVIKMINQLLHK